MTTGFRDKNNSEILEGDLVTCKFSTTETSKPLKAIRDENYKRWILRNHEQEIVMRPSLIERNCIKI